MMALIMVAVIIAATNPEVLVCARHCLRKYSYLTIFIYLAVWGLSCGTQDLRSLVCELRAVACGI